MNQVQPREYSAPNFAAASGWEATVAGELAASRATRVIPGGHAVAATASQGPQAHAGLIIFALWFVVFASSSQLNVIVPMLPRIGEAFAIPETLRGTLVSAFAVTLSVVGLIAGPLSDIIGRRRIMLLGCVSMAVALALHVAAYSYLSLFLLRALAGVGGGMLSGSAVAYIGDYFPPQKRGWATGYVLSAIAFAQMIGIPAGTLLAGALNFRWTFVLFAFGMAVAAMFVWRCLPAVDHGRAAARFTPSHLVESYHRLFHTPRVLPAVLANLLTFATFNAYVVYLPAWLERTLSFSNKRIATMFFLGGTVAALASPIAGRLADYWGRRPLMILGHVYMEVFAVASIFMAEATWSVFVIFSAMTFSYAMRNVSFQPMLTMLVPGHQRGTLSSLSFAAGNVGMGLGGLLAGMVYGRLGFIGNCILVAAYSGIVALIVYFWLPEPRGDVALPSDGGAAPARAKLSNSH